MVSSPHGVSASIVLFNSPVSGILDLVTQFLRQGVQKVFIVDNSVKSYDALGQVVLPSSCEYIRSHRNLGYGGAHNVAIAHAQGSFRYHVVSNPDVQLGVDTVQCLTSFMDSNVDVGIAMPKLLNVDGSIQHCCRRSPVLWDYLSQIVAPSIGLKRRRRLEMRDHDYAAEMDVPCLSGCFMFARLSVLKAIGGFDSGYFLYFEDFDLSMRARQVSRNRYVPQTSIIHGRQSGHRHSARLRWLFFRSALRYFWRWGYFVSRRSGGRN